MAPIIILDLSLTGALLLWIGGYAGFHIFKHKRLQAYGTEVSALITQVRRDNIEHRTCLLIASWTDPLTGRRLTYLGYHLDLGYQPGQLVGIRLDPKHPSRNIYRAKPQHECSGLSPSKG